MVMAMHITGHITREFPCLQAYIQPLSKTERMESHIVYNPTFALFKSKAASQRWARTPTMQAQGITCDKEQIFGS